MSYRFNSKFFESHPNKDEIAFSYLSYDIAKYFFEVMRNVIVVGAIKYFADTTGHWALYVLFFACLAAMMFLIQSFFFSWRFKVFAHLFSGNTGKNLDFLLSFVFGAACIMASWILVFVVANQIAAATR